VATGSGRGHGATHSKASTKQLRSEEARLPKLVIPAACILAVNYAVGVLDAFWILGVLVAGTVLHLVWRRWSARSADDVSTLVLSALFVLPIADLVVRRTLVSDFGLYPLPAFPEVRRQVPSRTLVSTAEYGDLAYMTGRLERFTPLFLRMKTDEWGFSNGPDFDAEAEFDLLVLGDSFSVIDYYSDDEQECSYGAQLKRDEERTSINLAVVATGPWEQAVNLSITLPEIATARKAKLIWGIFTGNDLEESVAMAVRRAPLHERTRVAADNLRRQSGLRILFGSWLGDAVPPARPEQVIERRLPDGEPLYFLMHYVHNSRRSRADVEADPRFDALTEAFTAVESLATQRDLELAILVVPSKPEVYSWILEGGAPWTHSRPTSGMAEAILGWCAGRSIRCHDLAPYLRDRARDAYEGSRAQLYLPDDTHWSAIGHRATYEYITTHVLD
jgi:hypothetical protein